MDAGEPIVPTMPADPGDATADAVGAAERGRLFRS